MFLARPLWHMPNERAKPINFTMLHDTYKRGSTNGTSTHLESLLPPHIGLHNPNLLGLRLFVVFPKIGSILVLIDQHGDEHYQPMIVPIEGGFPKPAFGDAFAIKWNVYVVQGQPLQLRFEVFQRVWGRRPNPPAITGMFVAGFAHPDFLVEIDVVAVVPQQSNEEQVR
jgi:hypothetical protein